jgi:hypothetical protein
LRASFAQRASLHTGKHDARTPRSFRTGFGLPPFAVLAVDGTRALPIRCCRFRHTLSHPARPLAVD